ncbi:hypothetical protein LF887_11620 [Chryseobacterium sp. MEBOG06]|uniref:hypothetical protein n=1 Tax=unclassified Chryseobacterium TaxID=2593645 RepID=UPI001F1CA007|nr:MULTISPECIES: hypothetical protein [unclassified Chryseobacterium]UKB86246.1 hypothetical protein LF887_11620 [Chryseobacterium sp. MEBOG06]
MKSLKEFLNEQLENPIETPLQEEQSPEATNTNIQEAGKSSGSLSDLKEVDGTFKYIII